MENASKALLFAAGILIAIILISVAVYIVSMSQESMSGTKNAMSRVQLMQFNQQFTTFEGRTTGSQIKQLISTINTNNTNDPDQLVDLDVTGCTGVTLTGTKDKGDFSTKGLGSSSKYEVSFEYTNEAVSKVIIKDIAK